MNPGDLVMSNESAVDASGGRAGGWLFHGELGIVLEVWNADKRDDGGDVEIQATIDHEVVHMPADMLTIVSECP